MVAPDIPAGIPSLNLGPALSQLGLLRQVVGSDDQSSRRCR